jgi:ankyrin repeat protein
MTQSTPTLYRLAAERRYNEIPEHVTRHPEDVIWRDHYGSTALHLICRTDAGTGIASSLLAAVDAIVSQAPFLVKQPNVSTWTPLHFACAAVADGEQKRFQQSNNISIHIHTDQVILKLIEACPEAVSCRLKTGFKDNNKTPFHIACGRNAPMNVLRAFLRVDPSLATVGVGVVESRTGAESPLQMVWDANQTNRYSSLLTRNTNRQESAAAMSMLLRAAFCGSVQDDDDNNNNDNDSSFRLVHATCSIPCPKDFVSQVMEETPASAFLERDHKGWVPLHHAIQSASVAAQQVGLDYAQQSQSSSYTGFLVESLVTKCPQAAAIPIPVPIPFPSNTTTENNKPQHEDEQQHKQQVLLLLPLHVMIMDAKMTWHKGGVQELVYAYPDALVMPDPRNGLVPFLESAILATNSRLHLSTTFEMLRAAPEMVRPHT